MNASPAWAGPFAVRGLHADLRNAVFIGRLFVAGLFLAMLPENAFERNASGQKPRGRCLHLPDGNQRARNAGPARRAAGKTAIGNASTDLAAA